MRSIRSACADGPTIFCGVVVLEEVILPFLKLKFELNLKTSLVLSPDMNTNLNLP